MGYKIITDSTIDMDHKMIEELGLTVYRSALQSTAKHIKTRQIFRICDGNFLRKAPRGQNVHHIADQRRRIHTGL